MSNRSIALPSGSMVETFEIRRVIGTGGFGVTYLGFDRALERPVAIKEYCPQGIADRDADDTTLIPATPDDHEMFSYGLTRFLDEARTLAKFQHPSIVHVHRFLEANGTGYLVMDYEEGRSLWQLLLRQKKIPEAQLLSMLIPVLEGLEVVHAQKYLHRDIKPGNIIMRDAGGPVLLDFGAARQALEQQGAALTVMLTPGYAPIEQYSSTDQQGPWSDLYALGATCYHCMLGEAPLAATDRVATFHGIGGDPVHRRLDDTVDAYSEALIEAVKWMLEAVPASRPQRTAEVLRELRRVPPTEAASGDERLTMVDEKPADFEKSTALAEALQVALEKSGVKVARKVVGPAMNTASSYGEMVDFLAGFILDDNRQSVFVEHARALPQAINAERQHLASAQVLGGDPAAALFSGAEPNRRDRGSADSDTDGGASAGPPTTESLRDEVIAHAERHLADFVGPIASFLVEQAASTASNREEFYRMLADELDSPQEREAFLLSLR